MDAKFLCWSCHHDGEVKVADYTTQCDHHEQYVGASKSIEWGVCARCAECPCYDCQDERNYAEEMRMRMERY